ncbi:MAG: hypothetical protein QW275_03345, partial [Candidatus Anstonellaceae archaeon]
ERLSDAESKLAKIEFSEEEYAKCRKELEDLRLEHAKSEANMKSEQSQLELIGKMLAKEKEDLSNMMRKQALALRYAEASNSMEIYKNSLVAAQSEMRNFLVEEINQALAHIWPSIYPYKDYSEVKIEADGKDYRFMMLKGDWMEVDSIASGGERACFCLALRIAFAAVLTPNLSWLILDEPTHNLDSEAVSLLAEAIGKKIPSIVEQTFVITHDSSLGEGIEGAVFRLDRDKAKNEPTRLEKEESIKD